MIDKALSLLEKKHETLPIFYTRTNSKIYFISEMDMPSSHSNKFDFIKGAFNEDGLIFNSVASSLLEKGLYTIMTEGGGKINSSLIEQNSADELFWFVAPKIVNDQEAISMLGNNKFTSIENTLALNLIDIKKLDQDVLLHYYFENVQDI